MHQPPVRRFQRLYKRGQTTAFGVDTVLYVLAHCALRRINNGVSVEYDGGSCYLSGPIVTLWYMILKCPSVGVL